MYVPEFTLNHNLTITVCFVLFKVVSELLTVCFVLFKVVSGLQRYLMCHSINLCMYVYRRNGQVFEWFPQQKTDCCHHRSGVEVGWLLLELSMHKLLSLAKLFFLQPSTRIWLNIYLTFIEYHCVLYVLCDGNFRVFFCMLYVQQVSISVVLSKLDTVKVGTCRCTH